MKDLTPSRRSRTKGDDLLLRKQARAQRESWLTQANLVSPLFSKLTHLTLIWLFCLDAVSYGQHVEKLLEMIANDGDIGGIEALYKETFTGRRHFVQSLSVTDLTTIFKEHCPLLRQVKYVSSVVGLFKFVIQCR